MLACPFCAHTLPGAEKFLGKTGRCPKCGGSYRFPATADGNTVGVKPPPAGATPAKPAVRPAAARPPQRPVAPRAPSPPAASSDPLLPDEVPVARIDEPSAFPFPMPTPKRPPKSSAISGNLIGGVLVLLLIFGGGGYSVWRKMEGERCRKFNDDLVKTCGRLETLTEPIQPQLNAWQVGNDVDAAQLQAGYDACLATLDDVEKRIDALETPNRATARAFVAKAKEFLELEREILKTDIKRIVELLSNSKLSREEVQKEMIKVAVGAVAAQQREQEKALEIHAAQKAFAKEVGMELR